jgi:hypothetical protein
MAGIPTTWRTIVFTSAIYRFVIRYVHALSSIPEFTCKARDKPIERTHPHRQSHQRMIFEAKAWKREQNSFSRIRGHSRKSR